MRILTALTAIWIAAGTPCSAEEVSDYYRRLSPESPVIIFLHGVLGDSKSTWKNTKTHAYWPDLLKSDPTFSGASIYMHEYNTEMFKVGSLNIDELATQLRQILDAKGVTRHQYLIFVAHSMGGLVVREFLIKYREEVADKTRFIFLLATPTTGSAFANWGALVARNNPQFTEMKKGTKSDHGFLAHMSNEWAAAGLVRKILTYCAYEKEPIYPMWLKWLKWEIFATWFNLPLVVDRTSATSQCSEEGVPVQADHQQIAKPESSAAIQYLTLKRAFKKSEDGIVSAVNRKQALVDRGYEYLRKGQWNLAIGEFKEALDIDAGYVPALKNLGEAYFDKNDYVLAIQTYNKLIDLEPQYAEHFYNRGAAYLDIGEYNQAIEDFTKAIRLDFYDNALALYARGFAKQCKGDGGKVDMDEARRIDPDIVNRQQAKFFCSASR